MRNHGRGASRPKSPADEEVVLSFLLKVDIVSVHSAR
jgi:hypothetical protein